jgi:hypothetical protein
LPKFSIGIFGKYKLGKKVTTAYMRRKWLADITVEDKWSNIGRIYKPINQKRKGILNGISK